jgi:uncharacterized protein (TIGR02117 family)
MISRRAVLRALPLVVALSLMAGCARSPVQPYSGAAPKQETLYLIDGGWHTEIALSRAAARDLPAPLKEAFTDARYLVFGWGARDYYMARDPGLGDALRALVPGPAVVLVIPLATSPAEVYGAAHVVALPVSRPGLARLADYLWSDIAKEDDGAPRRVGAGPEPGSLFYASTETYDATHTCNAWTAIALATAGLPIDPGGVVFADGVLSQARALGGRTSSP